MARHDDYRAELESAKRASPAQLLIRAARLLNEHAIARIRQRGRGDVRVSHASLLPHIDLEGTRITEIARRMGVTKQAVNQAVSEIEALGLVRRKADPSDGRAKLVLFTAKGRFQLDHQIPFLGYLEPKIRIGGDELTKGELIRIKCDTNVAISRSEVLAAVPVDQNWIGG